MPWKKKAICAKKSTNHSIQAHGMKFEQNEKKMQLEWESNRIITQRILNEYECIDMLDKTVQ